MSHVTRVCGSFQLCAFECVLWGYLVDTQTRLYALINRVTHCSTLQHTAAHCSTLQHTAAHCSTLQHVLWVTRSSACVGTCVCTCVAMCVCVRTCAYVCMRVHVHANICARISCDNMTTTFLRHPPTGFIKKFNVLQENTISRFFDFFDTVPRISSTKLSQKQLNTRDSLQDLDSALDTPHHQVWN